MGVHSTKQVGAPRSFGGLWNSTNVLPGDACSHSKLSVTRRSEAGTGFRGADGERIRNHGQRKFKVRMTMWREAHGRWRT